MSSRPFLTDCGCDCAVNTQEPTAANGWKGELLISDPYNGADVFGEFRDLSKISEISELGELLPKQPAVACDSETFF